MFFLDSWVFQAPHFRAYGYGFWQTDAAAQMMRSICLESWHLNIFECLLTAMATV